MKPDHWKYFFRAMTITTFFFSCNPFEKSVSEQDAMIKVATEFLEVVKTNDTAKAKAQLLYGLSNNDEEGFAYSVNQAAQVINKYGLPKPDQISLDSSIHNVPTTIAVIFPIYQATNPEDKFQKAITKVFVQKNLGKYSVVFFDNEYQNKMTPLVP